MVKAAFLAILLVVFLKCYGGRGFNFESRALGKHIKAQFDKEQSLPGQPSNGQLFDQYPGYIRVDPKAGRALFYCLVDSPQNSSPKPLVLWLNGGPGCSSFGNGSMMELGPFRVQHDGVGLNSNPYVWNNGAGEEHMFVRSLNILTFAAMSPNRVYTLWELTDLSELSVAL